MQIKCMLACWFWFLTVGRVVRVVNKQSRHIRIGLCLEKGGEFVYACCSQLMPICVASFMLTMPSPFMSTSAGAEGEICCQKSLI